MRYLGNKTRLIPFIQTVLRRRGIAPGRALDPFTGTASVARALKNWGCEVLAADIMEYGRVLAHAYIGLDEQPGPTRCNGGDPAGPLALVARLNALEPDPGFMHEHFSPAGEVGAAHARMYFTPENAARIDSIRSAVEGWRREGALDADGYYYLLASLLEAADRVANTAGIYAACIKSWQANARQPLRLRPIRPCYGPGSRAIRSDALDLVRSAGTFDLLYLDPPYNERQYAAYYHIPELIAEGWFDGPIPLRGKTGLPPDREKRSDWSRRRRCEQALEELLASASCRHVVMSYNSEGIIGEQSIERIMKAHGRRGTYRRYTRRYRRYRSDSDGESRRYRTGKLEEHLYCVDR